MSKGDEQRPTDKKKFDPNYDGIKWKSKKKNAPEKITKR